MQREDEVKYSAIPRGRGRLWDLLTSQALGSGHWALAHTWERLAAAALVWLLSLAIPLWLQRCRVLGEVTVGLGMR